MFVRPLALAAAVLAVFAAVPAAAQEEKDKPAAAEKTQAIPDPKVWTTRHKGVFNGQSVPYRAIAGETYLKDKDGNPNAAIFSTSYIREGVNDATRRPVTFLFNGGPGSGSLWLHMGAFGPKRVVVPSDARDDAAPPYPIVHNPLSLLDVTDLVFIDPVGTGFGTTIGKGEGKEFWGVTKDAKSIAQFIRQWLNEHGRWNSPKFLGGESYGTTRTAAVANELEGSYNDVALNGLILISSVLDFGVQAEVEGNEMAYVVNLPSMAAAAWYHDKVPNRPGSIEPFVEEARQFAIGPYASALLKGQDLPADERARIRSQLARYTGLSETYLENANLRVYPGRFYKELLRDRGLTVGRLDTRYTGRDYDNAGEGVDNDPSFYGIDGAYAAAVNAYLRGDLGVDLDRNYISIGSLGGQWDWKVGPGRDDNFYMNVAPYIGKALRENSGLRVFVAQGYYDMATPFFGAEYSLKRPGFPQDRIRWEYYGSGHMMYVRDDDLTKLANDVRSFIAAR